MVSTTAASEPRTAAAWVAAFAEGWRDPGTPERLAAHFEPMLDARVRLVQPQLPTVVGRAAFRNGFAMPLLTLIPDLRGDVIGWAARDDLLFIELRLRGTLGGRAVSWTVVDRITLRDGLATERVSYTDPAPVLAAALRRPRAWPRLLRFWWLALRRRLGSR